MLFVLSCLLGVAHATTAFPTAVTLKTEDGVSLHAAYGAPSKATYGVVFVHMAGRTKEDWTLLAGKVYRQDVQVLTVDLRGHGANGAPAAGAAPDYAAMVKDVRAAVAYLRAKGCSHVALVGAELGANLAINEAADDPAVVDVVLLSPGVDYKGVISTDAVRRYGERPLLLVASQDDVYGARSVTTLDRAAVGPHTVKLLDGAGKGTTMLNRDPTLESLLLGWIQAHWAAQGAAPASGTGPAIKVETHPIETTGPQEPEKVPPPSP